MLKRISIDELVPGMYVNQVLEQSGKLKMRSKGIVKTQSIVEALKGKGILVLEIDMSKSKLPKSVEPTEPAPTSEPEPQVQPQESKQPKAKLSEADALNAANDLYMQAVLIQGEFIESLQQGAANDLSSATDLSQNIIDSVFDSPDALSCLTMIKDADKYLLEHSINCSILMAIFCQHLGYSREQTDDACLGALLMDVGMSTIPEELYHQTHSLSEADWSVIHGHVDAGVAMVEPLEDITDLTLAIIQQHHEREDGSGYPRGLASGEINEFAKMAAIVDSYDAMISERPYHEPMSPSIALKRLTKEQGLDKTLLKQFIACIGIHPVGSLVKLRSGKLGIVSSQNKDDMLSPAVMTFYSVNGNHFNEIKRIDLSKVDDEIVSGIKPDEFGIDLPRFFRDVFLNQMPQ